MDIAKSVILITAAGTPTGRAMTDYFCALGAKVALVDSQKERLDAAHQHCLKKYSDCDAFLLKAPTIEKIHFLFNKIKAKLGSVDVLINYWQTAPLPRLLNSEPFSENSIANMTSTLYIFGRCAAVNMMDRGKGVIINIPYLQETEQNDITLTSSNSVIRGLTLSWGQELAKTEIRVGALLKAPHSQPYKENHSSTIINYDMIETIAYIVENDSFTSRVIEIH